MTKHEWSFFCVFFKQYRLSSKVDLNYWIQTYVVLLEEYFPPFRRQYPRFLLFCPFKHASFGYSSPAVLSFLLRQNGEGGGLRRPDVLSEPDRKPSWECPERPEIRQKKPKKKPQPSTSLLTEAPVAAAAPGRSKIKTASEGIWAERKPGGGEWGSFSLSDTPQLMLCSCGWSLAGLRVGLYHYQQGEYGCCTDLFAKQIYLKKDIISKRYIVI